MVIGVRPGGSSSSAETSGSPESVSASVRGIGVSVITSTCGERRSSRLPASACRCSTRALEISPRELSVLVGADPPAFSPYPCDAVVAALLGLSADEYAACVADGATEALEEA